MCWQTYAHSYACINMYTAYVYITHIGSDGSESDSLSTGAVAALACIVTLIVSVPTTAIITYIICVKRKHECIYSKHQSTQERVLYEQVGPPSSTITRNNLQLQPVPTCETSHTVTMDTNPAYQTSHKVTMDTNLAYQSYL